MGRFLADAHAVDEGHKHREESEDENHDANVPDEGRIVKLENDYEADGDQDEGEVDKDQEAADPSGVGTERVGSRPTGA